MFVHETNCCKICVLSNYGQKQNWLSVSKDLQDQAKKDRKFLSMVFLLAKMKIQLKGQQFNDIAEIQVQLQVVQDGVMEREFQRSSQQWESV
jgi:hypothetical protein